MSVAQEVVAASQEVVVASQDILAEAQSHNMFWRCVSYVVIANIRQQCKQIYCGMCL